VLRTRNASALPEILRAPANSPDPAPRSYSGLPDNAAPLRRRRFRRARLPRSRPLRMRDIQFLAAGFIQILSSACFLTSSSSTSERRSCAACASMRSDLRTHLAQRAPTAFGFLRREAFHLRRSRCVCSAAPWRADRVRYYRPADVPFHAMRSNSRQSSREPQAGESVFGTRGRRGLRPESSSSPASSARNAECSP